MPFKSKAQARLMYAGRERRGNNEKEKRETRFSDDDLSRSFG